MKRMIKLGLACAMAATWATAASAHPGHGGDDLIAGMLHPATGLDHLLAMVAVGMLAVNLGGRSLLMLPATFVATVAMGAMLSVEGMAIPLVEGFILTSVVVLGAAIALDMALPAPVAALLVGFFGVFHGAAHGAEIPAQAAMMTFGPGFIAGTAALHLVGVAAALTLRRLGDPGARLQRLGGLFMSATGLGLVAGLV